MTTQLEQLNGFVVGIGTELSGACRDLERFMDATTQTHQVVLALGTRLDSLSESIRTSGRSTDVSLQLGLRDLKHDLEGRSHMYAHKVPLAYGYAWFQASSRPSAVR